MSMRTSCQFPFGPQVSQERHHGLSEMLILTVNFITRKEQRAWGIHCFYNKQSTSLLFVSEEDIASFLKAAPCKHNPEKWPREGAVEAFHSWQTQQEVQGGRDAPWVSGGVLPTATTIGSISQMKKQVRGRGTLLTNTTGGAGFKHRQAAPDTQLTTT